MYLYHYHHQSVLPKGRYFAANLGAKTAVLPKGRSSTSNLGTKVAVLLRMNRCASFPLLSASHSLLASEQTLKDLKRSQGHHVEVRRVDLVNWSLPTSPKFTREVKYQFHQRFWPAQRSGNPNHPYPPLFVNGIDCKSLSFNCTVK